MLFHQRKQLERGELPTIASRGKFPDNVRTQCIQILKPGAQDSETIVKFLRVEFGMYKLNNAGGEFARLWDDTNPYYRELLHFFHQGLSGGKNRKDTEYAFTVLELLCRTREKQWRQDLVKQVNEKLKQSGIGYKFANGFLIPSDDENLTESAIVPALSILNTPLFAEAAKYLHQAFKDFKEGGEVSLQSSIDNSQKAGEMVLKTIFDKKNIQYKDNEAYMPLLERAAKAGLFPFADADKLSPLTSALKGLGRIRNQGGGHGKTKIRATDRLARLALNHTTSNILYIAETYLEEGK